LAFGVLTFGLVNQVDYW